MSHFLIQGNCIIYFILSAKEKAIKSPHTSVRNSPESVHMLCNLVNVNNELNFK